MRVDLRVKHDIEARRAAIELFGRGHGSRSAARALSVPRGTVCYRQWIIAQFNQSIVPARTSAPCPPAPRLIARFRLVLLYLSLDGHVL